MLRLATALAGLTLVGALANVAVWLSASTEWLTNNNWHGLMAMSTATAFALLGGVLMLHLLFAERRWAQTTVWAAAVVAAVAGLHIFIGRTAGQSVSWEAWLNSAGPVTRDVVQMQRATAVLLILAAFSLRVLTLRATRLPWVKETAVVVAGIVAVLAFLSVVSSAAGNPVFQRTELLKMGVFAALGFCVFNCALLLSVSHTGRLRRLFFGVYEVEDLPPLLRNDRTAFGILGLTILVVLASIVFYLRFQTEHLRRGVEAELRVAAELKAAQLTAWRQERLNDARAFASIPDLSQILQSLSTGQAGAERRAELERWLEAYARIYNYERVLLLDATLTPMLAGTGGITPEASYLEAQLRAANGGRADVLMLPPTADQDGELCLDILAPLTQPPGQPPVGAVLLQSKPGRSILRMLEVWPHGNETGQFVLWRRVGNRLYSLGGYRPQAGLAAADRLPFKQVRDLDDPNLLISRVATGETGLLEGTDARGIPIVGLGRLIPNTDWLLTCRMDARELYGPLRRSAWQIVGMTMLVFGSAGFFLTRRLRHQQLDLVRDRIVAELAQKRTEARLGAVMAHARDVMFILDENLNIIEANQCAIDTYGWSLEEFRGMNMRDLRSAASLTNYPQTVARIREEGAGAFESEHRRRDGSVFPIDVRTSLVDFDGRKHFFPIIRDITERKAQEQRIAQLAKMYQVLSHINDVIIHTGEKEKLLNTACSLLVDLGEFKLATVVWHDAAARTLRPIAHAGDATDYVNRLAVAADDRPEGQGPIGTAFRENRTHLSNDHSSDPTTLLWRDRTERAGFHASVAIPIRQRGQPLAVLSVYDERPGRFSAEEVTLLEKAAANLSYALESLEQGRQRRQAEANLRESEERYRLIAENTLDVIWLYDLAAHGFTYVSPSVFAQRGYRPEELVGQPLAFSLPAEAARQISAALEKEIASAERRNFNIEIDQKHKDGRIVPTEVAASLLRDAAGRPTHLLGITRDITERKRAQHVLERFNADLEEKVEQRTAELAARNQETQALLDAMPDTVLLCDEHGTLIFARSVRYPAVTGLVSGTPVPGQRPLLDAIFREIVAELHPAALRGRETVVREFERHVEDGTLQAVEGRAAPIGAHRVLILLRDITARKRLERDVLANLDREKQLSEMKSQFVSVASHEFRTPLAAAVGSLELLERHAARLTEAKRVELITRIQRSLGRLTSIMNDVLQLSRADSGRVKVKRMDVDLGQFVQDIINEVQAGDGEKHRFEFHRTGGPDVVPVDQSLVNHILSNLVGNAARYAPAGTAVTVHLEIAADAFTLRVVDEGIGIPEADRDRVFEPFARGSNVGQIGGTGLGLNIVKRYTEILGGRIELLPSTRGAVFQVTIPLHQPPS